MDVLSNACVLTENGFRERQTVVIRDGLIHAVMDDNDFDRQDIEVYDLDGQTLLPGFIDIQVNGGGGVLFNDAPSVDGIRAIGAAHRVYGTTGFLPTLISDDLETVAKAIAATDLAIEAGIPGLLGIHLEGPFLSPAKLGAQPPFATKPDLELIDALMDVAQIAIVTLAPELDGAHDLIRRLVARGVVAQIGHSDASFEEIEAALDAGAKGFTHL